MILFGNQQNRSKLVTYGNGLLYNWYAVSQANFAPAGWHVPTQDEFNTLITTLGGASVAGGYMKSIRTDLQPGWNSPNTGADDSSGFRGFGAGVRITSGNFVNIYIYGLFWCSNNVDSTTGHKALLSFDQATATTLPSILYIPYKYRGFSVRLLKDTTTWSPSEVLTDIDGNLYATVQIGTQVWLKSNWKCTKYNDGSSIPNVTDGNIWAGLTTPAYCSYLNQPIIEYTEKFPL
jgi:uncharacterized protein (TIGR02145 family)